ncbi:MAG: BatA domain-containing protein, partial [Planctomycetota bacterium]|nr:BatA domain-containing protein [Planctomycetota bacterium]
MSFLYASMLAGFSGLAAPIIIHLIARNKFPVQEFPGTWLLRAEKRDNVFAARLVDPLQLLIRLLVIALLV